jgi:hypothetical protein
MASMASAATNPTQSGTESANPGPDLVALKTRQQAAWSSGNYAIVGSTLQIVGEQLCEALDLKSGSKVLDVAAGNGMMSLAAARSWFGVNMTPKVETTASKLLSSNGRFSASASSKAMVMPSALARARPRSSKDGT